MVCKVDHGKLQRKCGRKSPKNYRENQALDAVYVRPGWNGMIRADRDEIKPPKKGKDKGWTNGLFCGGMGRQFWESGRHDGQMSPRKHTENGTEAGGGHAGIRR
jgi:hypothetical protein